MGKSLLVNISTDTPEIMKFGDVALDITESELLKHFSFGEMLRVTLLSGAVSDQCRQGDREEPPIEIGHWHIPFCQYFDEVEQGELLLCAYTQSGAVVISRNYGSFGQEIGLLMENNGDTRFQLRHQEKRRLQVLLSSEGRMPDYTPFFDPGRRKFGKEAPFRLVTGSLYRSSHPFDDIAWQTSEADKLAGQAGIRSVINLANTKEEAEKLVHFRESYCASCETAYINLPLNIHSSQFQCALKTCMDFIADHEPPFLIFCGEGRDRTGILVAILQGLLGVEMDEILSGYLQPFAAVCKKDVKEHLLAKVRRTFLKHYDVFKEDAPGYFRAIGVPERTLKLALTKLGRQK